MKPFTFLAVVLTMLLPGLSAMATELVLSCDNNEEFNSTFQVDTKTGRVVHLTSLNKITGQVWTVNGRLKTLYQEPGWIVFSDHSLAVEDRMVVVDSLNLNTLTIISKTMVADVKDDSPDMIFRCTITNKR